MSLHRETKQDSFTEKDVQKYMKLNFSTKDVQKNMKFNKKILSNRLDQEKFANI